MEKRKSISKKERFEVFKRDCFTCQYCGRKSPEVVLEVDHIKPVVAGGCNDLTNLITACYDCNRGKGKRELSDDSIVVKQRTQLQLDQERINQIEMIAEWKNGLYDYKVIAVDKIEEYFTKHTNKGFSDEYKKKLMTHVAKYGLDLCYDFIDVIVSQYSNNYTKGLIKSEAILRNLKEIKENPIVEKVNYLATISKKNFDYNIYFGTIKSSIMMLLSKGNSIESIEACLLSRKHGQIEEFEQDFYHNYGVRNNG